jgi:NADH-quinone oxidoreductase subunit N
MLGDYYSNRRDQTIINEINNNMTLDFFLVAPEIALLIGAMCYQLKGLFFPAAQRFFSYVLMLFLAILAYLIHSYNLNGSGFNEVYYSSDFTNHIKVFILILTSIIIAIYLGYDNVGSSSLKHAHSSYVTLMILSLLGMFLIISARDFMLLYIGVELQTLALFILAAYNTDDSKSSEAGLKYFILSALASGLMLFGISLIYGFSGSLNYKILNVLYSGNENMLLVAPPALIIGIVMLIVGLCFKISAAPFHMWAPDVYEGSPIVSTIFFASVPKFANLVALINILFFAFETHGKVWIDIMTFVALASLIVGSFGAIMQTSIKRLMAYSSIVNIGYICLAIASNNLASIYASMLYFLIYAVSVIGFFATIISVIPERANEAQFADLAGMSKTKKNAAFIISVFAFSMIGIPPAAGFFGKFYIFKTIIETGHYFLAVAGVMASVVSAYYYLRIVKVMYFDLPENTTAISSCMSMSLYIVISLCLFFILGFLGFAGEFLELIKFPVGLVHD